MLPEKWTDMLDERQQKQVEFARLYASEYHHGADGHNNMMIIAALATFLDYWYRPGAENEWIKEQEDGGKR